MRDHVACAAVPLLNSPTAARGRLFDFATLILRKRCRAALTLKAELVVSRSGTLRAT